MKSKTDYQKGLDKLLEKLKEEGVVPSLLLHSCCAPCSSYVIEYLSNYFNITVFYYNPNIDTENEYNYRLNEQIRFISEIKTENPVSYIIGDYEQKLYLEYIKGLEDEPERGKRCIKCFHLRLKKTCDLAKKMDFDYFATTLTLSPLKDADLINSIGDCLAKEYGVKYLQSDFKKKNGYKRSLELSKEHNLYRQNFCGCAFSKNR